MLGLKIKQKVYIIQFDIIIHLYTYNIYLNTYSTNRLLIGPLPTTSKGNKYVATLIDHFSKWPEAAQN